MKALTKNPITWRPPAELRSRFEDVSAASKRTKSSLLHECVDEKLPHLEKQYAPELADLNKSGNRQKRKAKAA